MKKLLIILILLISLLIVSCGNNETGTTSGQNTDSSSNADALSFLEYDTIRIDTNFKNAGNSFENVQIKVDDDNLTIGEPHNITIGNKNSVVTIDGSISFKISAYIIMSDGKGSNTHIAINNAALSELSAFVNSAIGGRSVSSKIYVIVTDVKTGGWISGLNDELDKLLTKIDNNKQ